VKPVFIYLISLLYGAQAIQLMWDKQYWPGLLVALYGLAGIPLIKMTQH
jgi:hypothetical protein